MATNPSLQRFHNLQSATWHSQGRNDYDDGSSFVHQALRMAINGAFLPRDHQTSERSQAMRQTEELLTSEFHQLSVQDQSRALNDLYHAGSMPKEDPVMIDNLLAEFEHEVEQGRYPIYEQALKQDRSYVEDPAFRLKFLRANMHDVKKAVSQMIKFLNNKAKYFGDDKIAADITLDDITPDELKIILSGIYHIQDGRDRNGRVILWNFNSEFGKWKLESLIRATFYIWFNILIPIHEVQMKGVLAVYYDMLKPSESPEVALLMTSAFRMADFASCLPIRYSGVHFCLKQEEGSLALNNLFLGLAIKAIPKYALERSKVHFGSDLELQYQLANCGVPLDTFPVDVNGNFRDSLLNAWFHKHWEAEGSVSRHGTDSLYDSDDDSYMSCSSSDGSDGGAIQGHHAAVVVANDGETGGIFDADVLLGRGRLVQNHPGNVLFRDFLDERRDEYEVLSRNDKRKARIKHTRELLANGVRFMRQTDSGLWVVCDFDEVVEKVAQFYRTRRRSVKRAKGESCMPV